MIVRLQSRAICSIWVMAAFINIYFGQSVFEGLSHMTKAILVLDGVRLGCLYLVIDSSLIACQQHQCE
jgi:hypothetical protein